MFFNRKKTITKDKIFSVITKEDVELLNKFLDEKNARISSRFWSGKELDSLTKNNLVVASYYVEKTE